MFHDVNVMLGCSHLRDYFGQKRASYLGAKMQPTNASLAPFVLLQTGDADELSRIGRAGPCALLL